MSKSKNQIWKKIMADTVAVILLAMLLLPVHSWLYDTSLLNMSEKSSAAASSLSYDIQRWQAAAVHSNEIALVDISTIYGGAARAEIADLLDTIYSMNPKRIGVDVFFPTSRTTLNPLATLTDSMLAATARRIADKAVFVCHLDSFDSDLEEFGNIRHSFFINNPSPDDSVLLSEGYANLVQDTPGQVISKYSLRQQAAGQKVWSFAAQIASDYIEGADTLDNEPIIRFDPTDFPCMGPDQIVADSIRDRIVLVGDMRDRGDSHLTPLGMMQGVELHAYAVQSILHYEKVGGVSIWMLSLISLVLCLLYTFLLFTIDYKLDVNPSHLLKFAIKQGMITLAATYLLNIVLQYIAYVSFTVFDTTLGLHALLPDLIKLVAFTKVNYSILVPLLYKRYGWKWLRYSCLIDNSKTPQNQTNKPNNQTK